MENRCRFPTGLRQKKNVFDSRTTKDVSENKSFLGGMFTPQFPSVAAVFGNVLVNCSTNDNEKQPFWQVWAILTDSVAVGRLKA